MGRVSAAAAPQHSPSPRELDDLELLTHGVLGEPARFEGTDGQVTLTLPEAVAAQALAAGAVELVDPEGTPLARVIVEETYPAGPMIGIEGPVEPLAHNEFGAYRRLYLSPEEARAQHAPGTVTVPVAGPLTSGDLDTIRGKAEGRPVVLLALAGTGTPTYDGRGLSATGLLRASLVAADLLDKASVVAVPLASRGPGQA